MSDRSTVHEFAMAGLALLPIPTLFVALGLFAFGAGSWGAAALLIAVLAWLAAGGSGLEAMPSSERFPPSEGGTAGAAYAGADAAVLAGFRLTLARVASDELERIRDELAAARARVAEEGWLLSPRAFHHPAPAPPENIRARKRRSGWLAYQQLSAESHYRPIDDFPGSARWSDEPRHRTNHAWCLRHPGEARPWVVCVHGFGLGRAALDFNALSADRLHRRRGYNLLFPISNFHGPRSLRLRSGDGFFSGDVLNTLHAMTQSIHDIRSWIAWLRAESGTSPSLFGVSLGAYHASTVAALEGGGPRIVLGVPMVDPVTTVWFHAASAWKRQATEAGIFADDVRELWSLTSALSLPEPNYDGKAIFAASADLMIPHPQLGALVDHWKTAALLYCQTGHVTFRTAPEVGRFVDDNLLPRSTVG